MKKRVLFVFALIFLAGFVLAQEPTCFDNDLGKNYSYRGVVADSDNFYADSCVDESDLSEYYCEDGAAEEIIVTCLDGCENGLCIGGEIVVCEPQTCGDLGYDCGIWGDGCGGEINCGGCNEGQVCEEAECRPIGSNGGGGGGGGSGCVPASCNWLGAECGLQDDGCGTKVDCGGCSDGEICQRGNCVAFSFGDGFDDAPIDIGGEESVVDEEGQGIWWWIIIIFFVLVIIAVLIFFFIKWKSLGSSALSGATLANSNNVPKPPTAPEKFKTKGAQQEMKSSEESGDASQNSNKVSEGFEIRTN